MDKRLNSKNIFFYKVQMFNLAGLVDYPNINVEF